jgi:hypothetical protein
VALVEADPAGGDLALRLDLRLDPGLGSLAAAARHGASPDTLWRHTQALTPGAGVVVAPPSAHEAALALSSGGPALAAALASAASAALVVVDAGRTGPDTPAGPLLHGAAAVVAVTRPHADHVAHVLSYLAAPGTRLDALVVVGDQPYPATEVAAALGLDLLGAIPSDPGAAEAVATGRFSGRAGRRSALGRAVRELGERLAARLGPGGSDDVAVAPAAEADAR